MITTRRLECTRRFRRYLGRTLGALLLAFPLAGLAETLMMPDRDGLVGQNIVVWGVTTLANGTNYTLDCGNGVITAAAPWRTDPISPWSVTMPPRAFTMPS